MYCRYCGAVVGETQKFCKQCGRKQLLEPTNSAIAMQAFLKSLWKFLKVCSWAMIFVSVILFPSMFGFGVESVLLMLFGSMPLAVFYSLNSFVLKRLALASATTTDVSTKQEFVLQEDHLLNVIQPPASIIEDETRRFETDKIVAQK